MHGRPDPARVAAVDEDRFEMRPIAPRLSRLKTRLQRLLAPAATALLGAAALALPAAADAQPLQLRIVGGLASVNQYRLHEEPFWSHRLSTLTQGRIQAEIVPFDRAGIRGQDMLRLLQLGVVPFGTALLSLAATEDPLVNMADLPGANPDIDTLRRAVAAFRPVLDQHLRQALGVELLAVYAYPAQVLFCRQAFGTLADLAKRRVRVVSAPQADFIEAIGAQAVLAPFAEVLPKLRSGQLDCAITGTMSGNTVGLHEVTTHLHTMPITWGLSVFAANKAAWAGLPADTRTLLQRELKTLEQAIWTDAERETGDGIACNTGSDTCRQGRRGSMVAVRPGEPDLARLRTLLAQTVLPRWAERCGPRCVDAWDSALAPVVGVRLRPVRQ